MLAYLGLADGQAGGNVVLDAVVFLLGVGLLGGILFWITKKILIDEKD